MRIIHRVCNRPNLFMGGDRELVMLTLLFAFTLIFAVQTWVAFIFGCSLWFFSLYFLRKIASYDPILRHVGLKSILKYSKYYPPRSRPYRINTEQQQKRHL